MPVYNVYDNDECRGKIDDYYESALSMSEGAREDDRTLNKSFQDLLDKQKRYGIELVNNADFVNWAQDDYWGEEWGGSEPSPREERLAVLSEDMIRVFGDPYDTRALPAMPLRTIEDMSDAISTLYWYRVDLNLEYPVMFRR